MKDDDLINALLIRDEKMCDICDNILSQDPDNEEWLICNECNSSCLKNTDIKE